MEKGTTFFTLPCKREPPARDTKAVTRRIHLRLLAICIAGILAIDLQDKLNDAGSTRSIVKEEPPQ